MAIADKISEGNYIDYTPASAVAQGVVVVQADLVCVAENAIPANTLGALSTRGVYSINKLATDVVAVGAILYWDVANSRATITASTHKVFGRAIAAAGNGATKVLALLNP
jgi:predicted RecA/RadA family phage recombinase